MKKFTFYLNEKQFNFLSSILPKGYSFTKLKGARGKTHYLDLQLPQKNDASFSKNSQQSSFQQSNSYHSAGKRKKQISQVEKIEKKQIENKLKKKSDSQSNERPLDRVKMLNNLLDEISKNKFTSIFIEPVDPIKHQIPHYFDIIKQPMDIFTMRKKIKSSEYVNFEQFQKDLEKISSNCITFNKGNKFFIKSAQKFSQLYQKVLDKNKDKIRDLFQIQNNLRKSQRVYQNSEQETNSQEEQISKSKLLIVKKNDKQNSKIQHFDENKVKSKKSEQTQKHKIKKQIKQNESLEQQSKQRNHIEQSSELERKKVKTDEKIENSSLNEKKQVQNTNKDYIQSRTSKHQSKKHKKIKKYSYDERLNIISRIKKLDKATMTQFFKIIKFQKGASLDFKVLQDEKIQQLEVELKKFELIHQEKVRQIQEKNQKMKGRNEQDFEIADDQDYKD